MTCSWFVRAEIEEKLSARDSLDSTSHKITKSPPMLGGNRKFRLDPQTQEKKVGKRSSQSRK
jgi:hypothetical protein